MLNKIYIALLFFGVSVFTFSQQYNFVNYSTEKGLAQSQVYDLIQDKNHNLWVATLDGLSKFNGKTFQNFYRDQGLQSNTINTLFCDNQNRIWVGTDKGLNIIDDDLVISIDHIEAINNSSISSIFIKDSTAYIAHAKNKVVVLKVQPNNKKHKLLNEHILKEKTRIKSISFFDKKIHLATNTGIHVIENGQVKTSPLIDSTINCSTIKKDFSNNIWIATLEQGVFKINSDTTINFTRENSFQLLNDYIRDLIIDHQNSIWITSKSGITRISQTNEVKNYKSNNGFNYVAETVLEDAEGNIWVGTEGKGIVRFVNEAFSHLTIKQGLHSDLILSFCEDNNGNIWFSSYGDGIAQKNEENYTKFNSLNSALINNTVWSSFKSSDGTLWFGTASGLNSYDGNNFKTYTTSNGLVANKVQSFYEDKNGLLWVGTRRGISTWNGKELIPLNNEDLNNVRAIENFQNKIYVATSGGLYQFKTDSSFVHINANDFDNKTIYCLAHSKEELFIGAEDGLYAFNNNVFKKIKLSEINSNSSGINFLHVSKNGTLWVGTNSGIYTKNLASNDTTYTLLTTEDGLIGVETNLNAIYEDSKGQIWIGTSEGVSIYNPVDQTIIKDFKLIVNLYEVKLFYENKNWIDNEGESFKYNRNNFTFYYNAPYYQKPSGVYYSFMLEGFDEDWSPADKNNFTRYSNIPHGTYTFKVRASIDLKNWSKEATYNFTIQTPFWLTWWFRIGFLAFIFGFTYWLFLRQRKRQREKRKAEILEYKNKLVKLEQQSLNASMNRHFIFNALNSIQFYINKEDKLSANRYLSSFAKLIRKNLDSSVNEDNLISLEEELDRLKLYMSLEKMRFKDRFDYEVDIDPEIDLEMNKVPGMFLQPFVENSIWHGILPNEEKDGLITLSIKTHGNGFKFIIEDNGIGIETSKKAKVATANTHISRGMEIASNRIAMLEKISGKNITLKGPYEIIENNEVKGTRVEVTFS